VVQLPGMEKVAQETNDRAESRSFVYRENVEAAMDCRASAVSVVSASSANELDGSRPSRMAILTWFSKSCVVLCLPIS